MRQATMENVPESYLKYTRRKLLMISLLILLTAVVGVYAINAGSADLSPAQVLMTLFGVEQGRFNVIIWNIRLPRVLSALVAGAGLSVAGCVMQNILRNPLASPFTLGISQGAACGAAVAIIALGAGSTGSTGADAVAINNPYLVTFSAFLGAMAATMVVLFLARFKGVTPEAMVLAGVALGSLFSAVTVVLQYFASDVQVASIVFWTFGDVSRASWCDLEILAVVTGAALFYFMANRWNYNALASGEETAKGLGVDVEKIRLTGMFLASLITAVAVSFLGIIGFIGLVGPHMMRRILGGDHRFLIPAASVAGGLLLLAADTVARTVIAPVVLPVGAITSFMGAPLFLYLLAGGYGRR
ncbi:FecCD family ABC transporter permease [Desulfotomaculum copahuensis]|uniref:Iron ABC transporter permease n=1 Tax=Desulfotomaculum copahuensis TaxID=1838280 RepID=A0A1B7LE03_9FIRM|nr:iron ABC transporter permease [Desulfotomaculum copahuensis]OAT81320.1 iron ABC transporter permease [Desulfotomaculum copahuensis]